jgi:Ca2+-binding RTX toxin-like protein
VGGLAADRFRFTSTTDAGTAAAKDTIADFTQAQSDRIDLSALGVTLSIRGTAALGSPASFGQIRWAQSGADTLIQIDTDGNTTADMEILLQNFTATNLTESDFTFATTAITYTAAGAESIFGGAGNDSLTGSGGADTIYGWGGNDSVHGHSGSDTIYGGAGNDTLNDGVSWGDSDKLFGEAGNDVLLAHNGNDTLDGGSGADSLTGSGGSDVFVITQTTDSILASPDLITDWNGSLDRLWLTNFGTYGISSISDFEIFSYNGSITTIYDAGTGFSLTFSGDVTGSLNNNNIFFGDIILGGSGSDTLSGTTYNDSIDGLIGNDLIYGNAGNDYLEGWAGTDTIYGGDGEDTISDGSAWSDSERLYGENGNDIILAYGGNDTIDGGAGKDTLTGGTGADVFTFTSTTHSTAASPDRITDFENGSDRIQLTGLGFTALSDFETLSFAAGVTTLADAGTSFAITFTGDVTALLDNTDFIW